MGAWIGFLDGVDFVHDRDALAGASIAERMCMLPGAWRPGSLSLIASHILWRGTVLQESVAVA